MNDSNRRPNDYSDFEALSARVRALETALAHPVRYLVSDDAATGIVFKVPGGHYWRMTLTIAGAPVYTDLGVTMPKL